MQVESLCRGDLSNDAPFGLLLLFLPEYFLVDVLAGYFLVLLVVVCNSFFCGRLPIPTEIQPFVSCFWLLLVA